MAELKANLEDLWPTKILALHDLMEEKQIKIMRDEIIKQRNKNPRPNWQSKANLHKQSKFKSLAGKVLELAKWHLETHYQVIFEDLLITDMWGNVLSEHEFHKPHNHSNNVISGVYYVQADAAYSPRIFFMDPRPQTSIIQPEVKEFTSSNSSVWYHPSVTNRCLLFPSWLSHYVESNITKEERISISFNFMYKGKIGSSEKYQSAEF